MTKTATHIFGQSQPTTAFLKNQKWCVDRAQLIERQKSIVSAGGFIPFDALTPDDVKFIRQHASIGYNQLNGQDIKGLMYHNGDVPRDVRLVAEAQLVELCERITQQEDEQSYLANIIKSIPDTHIYAEQQKRRINMCAKLGIDLQNFPGYDPQQR